MTIGQIDWSADTAEGVAAYQAFRQAAAGLSADDYPEIERLDDGGLFAMRLDAVLPPRPAGFEAARDDVLAQWQAEETARRLSDQAGGIIETLRGGASFAEADLDAIREENLLRSDFVPGTPPGFLEQVFEMSVGEVKIIESEAAVIIVRLDAVSPPDDNGDVAAMAAQLSERASQELARDLYDAFSGDVVRRANPQINQQALQAVHVNFP